MQSDSVWIGALVLAMVVKAVVDYLKLPLINTPHIVKWLIASRWAYEDGDEVTIWIIPYVTFALGLAMSLIFGLDLVSQYMPTAMPTAASKILTGAVIGAGSNVIHQLASNKRLTVSEGTLKRLL